MLCPQIAVPTAGDTAEHTVCGCVLRTISLSKMRVPSLSPHPEAQMRMMEGKLEEGKRSLSLRLQTFWDRRLTPTKAPAPFYHAQNTPFLRDVGSLPEQVPSAHPERYIPSAAASLEVYFRFLSFLLGYQL